MSSATLKVRIENLADVKPGDIVTFTDERDGHQCTVTGEAWSWAGDTLSVGPYAIQYGDGTMSRRFRHAEREVPVPDIEEPPVGSIARLPGGGVGGAHGSGPLLVVPFVDL